MNVWLHKTGRWYRYFKPKWLNPITWEESKIKIYRWLFWGYTKKEKNGNK